MTYIHPTRIFKNPEELKAHWEKYKAHLNEKSKEWEKIQYVGKDGKRVSDNPKLPLVLEGFYIYSRNTIGCIKQYFVNKGGYYNDFVTICSHIKEECRYDQITGGLLGFYNPSITQRLNGLVEKVQEDGTKEVTIKVKYDRKDNNTEPTAPSTGADTEGS